MATGGKALDTYSISYLIFLLVSLNGHMYTVLNLIESYYCYITLFVCIDWANGALRWSLATSSSWDCRPPKNAGSCARDSTQWV